MKKITRFTIITFWDSIESIKEFAGEEFKKAKYYEEDKMYLMDFPEKVEHYKIVKCESRYIHEVLYGIMFLNISQYYKRLRKSTHSLIFLIKIIN